MFFSDAAVERLRTSARNDEFGARIGAGRKVVFVLVDGLRWRTFRESRGWCNLTNSAGFATDGRIVKLRAELPTMSVPNYASMWSGAAPEITGVFGNRRRGVVLLDEPYKAHPYESIFDQMAAYNLSTSSFGNKPTLDIWETELAVTTAVANPQFAGYNPHNVSENQHGMVEPSRWSAEEVDFVAHRTVTGADFSMLYNEDVDWWGHRDAGTHTATENAVTKAVEHAADTVTAIMELADDNTVVMVVADHGMLDAGGHAGLEDDVRDVPFLVHLKGSGLGAVPVAQTGPDNRAPRNVDVATSICGVLGIPVPRQNHGIFIPGILDFAGHADGAELATADANLQNELRDFVDAYLAEIDDSRDLDGKDVAALLATFGEARQGDVDSYTKYTWIASALAVALLVVLHMLMVKTALHALGRDWVVSAVAFVRMLMYAAVMLCVFLAIFMPNGAHPVDHQFIWNSSQLDAPNHLTTGIVLAVAGLPVVLLIRAAMLKRVHSQSWSGWLHDRNAAAWDSASCSEEDPRDLSRVMLANYFLFHTTAFLCLCLVMGTVGRTFFVEGLWDKPYADDDTWQYRFVASHCITMFMPCVVVALVENWLALRVLRRIVSGKSVPPSSSVEVQPLFDS